LRKVVLGRFCPTAIVGPAATIRSFLHRFAAVLLPICCHVPSGGKVVCPRRCRCPLGRGRDFRGVVRSGRASRAAVRSCNRAWEYRPMVSVGVECRANSWQVLTDAPLATMPEM